MLSDKFRRLLEYARAEEGSQELQKLPYDSYMQIANDLSSSMTLDELDPSIASRVESIVRDAIAHLMLRRLNKIISIIREGREPPEDRLLTEEKRLIAVFRELKVKRGAPAKAVALASFKREFPILYSASMSMMGPFAKFDVAVLSTVDVEELSRRGVAERVL